jgi:hypothetical protein
MLPPRPDARNQTLESWPPALTFKGGEITRGPDLAPFIFVLRKKNHEK